MMLWTAAALLVLLAAVRYRRRLATLWSSGEEPRIDDEAIEHILREGRLPGRREHGREDFRAAAEAEDEFWAESWDEPEEYRP